MHAITREPLAALEEHSAFDARGNTAGVVGSSSSAAPAAAPAEVATAHGGAGGGGVGGATKAEADIARSGVQFGSGGIPKITMRDAFIVHGNIYTLAVEILMMLNSYYLAFYAVYFISRASKSSTDGVWIILLPLPILGGVLMAYRRVVPLIALLSTIVMMQPTDVADVRHVYHTLVPVKLEGWCSVLVVQMGRYLQLLFAVCRLSFSGVCCCCTATVG